MYSAHIGTIAEIGSFWNRIRCVRKYSTQLLFIIIIILENTKQKMPFDKFRLFFILSTEMYGLSMIGSNRPLKKYYDIFLNLLFYPIFEVNWLFLVWGARPFRNIRMVDRKTFSRNQEYTAIRQAQYPSSMPSYIYAERLLHVKTKYTYVVVCYPLPTQLQTRPNR